MKRKNQAWIFVVAAILLVLGGCSEKQGILSESEIFFYQKHYVPEKKHREEELILEEDCNEIIVQGTTTSGTIRVVIENKDQEGIKYEYTVDGSLSETIEIPKKHRKDRWILGTDINEETEGSVRLLFYAS